MRFLTHNYHTWLTANGVAARSRRWIASIVFLTTALICAAWLHPRRAQAEEVRAIHGLKAVRQLKADRSYDSLAAAVTAARAQSINTNSYKQQQKLIAPDGEDNDFLGSSIALSGDTVVVGAPRGDVERPGNQGSVYVFIRSGESWAQQQRLIASDGREDDYFGNSVAISGDTVVVGAFLADISANSNQGAVYIFTRSGSVWTQRPRLTASGGAAGDRFGHAVAISGDTIVVGADQTKIGMNLAQGIAYVFERRGEEWIQRQKLIANDGTANDLFGTSVAISGETIAIGAVNDNFGGPTKNGSVYVFARSGGAWVQRQKLNPIEPAAVQGFGFSVALSGETLVIGVLDDNSFIPGSEGSAYVFVNSRGVWTQQQKLIANDGAPHNYFSTSVAIKGETIAVGAFYDQIGDKSEQGEVFVFTRSGEVWTQHQRLIAKDGEKEDHFGVTVAMSGDNLVVGTRRDDIGDNADQGSAYIYRVSQPGSLTTVSAASFAGLVLARESIAAAFGSGLSESTESASKQPLPTTLAGIRVRVRDRLGAESFAPLFFASPNQINFQLPAGVALGKAEFAVLRGNETVAKGEATIGEVAPGLFSADASGRGVLMGLALRVRADGSQSYEPIASFDEKTRRFVAVPIDLGRATDRVFLVLFATGVRNRSSLIDVVVRLGGLRVDALYAGPQGSFAGLDQLNVELSRQLIGRGEVDVAIEVDGMEANILGIAFKKD